MKDIYLKKLEEKCTENELAKLVKLTESKTAKDYLNNRWLQMKIFLKM